MKYQLVEKRANFTETFIVTIIADGYDANDIVETMYYDKEGFEEIIDELIKLRDHYSKERYLRDYPNPKDFHIPCDAWGQSAHTLVKLTVDYADELGKLWEVKF